MVFGALSHGDAAFADHRIAVTDRHKLLQILISLITNARQALDERGHAAPGAKVPQLIARAREQDGLVAIAVIDNGVGIPLCNLHKIFRHGFGLHTSAAAAARELGGRLHVASDGPGHGATFTLELPAPASDSFHDLGN